MRPPPQYPLPFRASSPAAGGPDTRGTLEERPSVEPLGSGRGEGGLESSLSDFHPIIQRWFLKRIGTPSEPQKRGWPLIRSGKDVLIAAPTGSGKTLSAFLACLDDLFRRALLGTLEQRTRVVYVSPLKALGNDVQKNLLGPLQEICELARQEGHNPQEIRVAVRTGDTKPSERQGLIRKPPHILITTPESLYLYLTAQGSRKTLSGVEAVVVDEIHALARDKRGSHLSLSLERLKALIGVHPQLIGLSATQKPLDRIAQFLTGVCLPGDLPSSAIGSGRDEQGQSRRGIERVQVGHLRPWDIRIELPEEELSGVATHEQWGQIYDRIEQLLSENRTILAFANTRRLAERMAHDLGERLGKDKVAAHHGSMSRELRLSAEERLKAGELRVMCATASLELGIDIGAVDLVVQIGTPRAIAVALQRVGRAGHFYGGISKGVFFALTRDDLVECAALLWAIREGDLDAVLIPEKPLDILAQHLVAACATEDWDEEALFSLCRRAYPYRELSREEFESVVHMLSEGVATSRGRAVVHLHRDRVHGKLRARKGARISALVNGGAIPDTFIYPVIAEPEDKQVGTLDEDFAVESMAGDVFVLGSTTWRIQRIMAGTVRVENAHGAPPTVPFWRGEAPSRTCELSTRVGRFRQEVVSKPDAALWLTETVGLSAPIADFLVRYLRSSAAALGAIPSDTTVVAERFFDEAGGMQLLLHAPFGGRINRAWGLTLRKKFCRSFDFELQAAAVDDGIVLSLGEQHSFPLEEIFSFVTPENVEETLVQAVLQTPLFGTRFRWNATRALCLSRMSNGKKVPPQIQRARSDDLLAAVFPAQVGCQDNHGGADVELPDHPLVKETMANCLREAMDVDGLKAVLQGIREGRIRTVAVDTAEPSPLSHQLLNSAPYSYLDDAPLEERRARAVSLRRTLPAEDQVAFGALDAEAISQTVSGAQPPMRDADELHDALLQLILLPEEEAPLDPFYALERVGRAVRMRVEEMAVPSARVVQPFQFNPVPLDVFAVPPSLQPSPAAGEGETEGERVTEAPRTRGMLEERPSVERLGSENWGEGGRSYLVSRERLLYARAPFPNAQIEPALEPLPGDPQPSFEEAVLAATRGWMECCGPTTSPELGMRLNFPTSSVDEALYALEREGVVLRGRFRSGQEGTEWCDRRLLQRIHRLTVGRLRAEIQPLSPQDCMRFLFRWHHLDGDDRLRGEGGLLKAVSLLQGYEAPASAWESALFPARMAGYQPDLLERACFRGEIAWGRFSQREPRSLGPRRGAVVAASAPGTRSLATAGLARSSRELEAPEDEVGPKARSDPRAVLTRNASITFCKREDLDVLLSAARPGAVLSDGGIRLPTSLSAAAKDVVEALERRGASFFRDLLAQTRRLPAEVEDALGELLAVGLVTADAVENLRVLQSPLRRKRWRELQRGGPGRWSLLAPAVSIPESQSGEALARLFLRRYGIVWRDLLVREPLCPPWRELLFVYRRMEARGEVRGGRFAAGFVGEQFALPEAVDIARAVRRTSLRQERVTLAAVDPLNLTGIVTPGAREPAIPGRYVTYLDGIPVGAEEHPDEEELAEGTETV